MKSEWYRLIKSDVFYIVCFLSVLFIMAVSFHYYQNKYESSIYLTSQIEVYTSIEDIDVLLTDTIESIDNLDENSTDYNSKLEKLETNKKIYTYLQENYCPFEELYEFSAINGYEDDSLVYYQTNGNMIYILLIVVSIVIGSFMLNQDFLLKTQINLYTAGSSRKAIYFRKLKTYISLVFLLYVFMFMITLLFGTDYVIGKDYLLLVGEEVNIIKTSTYILYMLLINLVDIILLSSIIFMILSIFKNLFAAIFVSVIFIAIFGFVVPWYYPNLTILFLIQPTLDWFSVNVSINGLIFLISIKLGILLLLTIISSRVFNKRKLV